MGTSGDVTLLGEEYIIEGYPSYNLEEAGSVRHFFPLMCACGTLAATDIERQRAGSEGAELKMGEVRCNAGAVPQL